MLLVCQSILKRIEVSCIFKESSHLQGQRQSTIRRKCSHAKPVAQTCELGLWLRMAWDSCQSPWPARSNKGFPVTALQVFACQAALNQWKAADSNQCSFNGAKWQSFVRKLAYGQVCANDNNDKSFAAALPCHPLKPWLPQSSSILKNRSVRLSPG